MNSLSAILQKLKLDISTDLPALITSAGLEAFAVFNIGTSRNAEQMGFFIYFDNDNFDNEFNKLTIILQMQLYKKDELDGAKYRDVLSDYMKDYNTSLLGMDIVENIENVSWGLERSSTTFIASMITFSENIDSCT